VFEPVYIKAHRSGRLEKVAGEAERQLANCRFCPRLCGVNRLEGELGYCKTGRLAKVSSANPHFGEETPLVGHHGSGTVFFARCNLLCSFCQNHDISHGGGGTEVSARQLADLMLELQKIGCHNINFVTPSHVVSQILSALVIAVEEGLRVPLVYNTGGYDLVRTLELLDGVVDIYMPDLKFMDGKVSARLMNAPDYPEVAKAALKEMHRQVGDLVINEEGTAERGLLVRHLVMPNDLNSVRAAMRFLSLEISPYTYVNVMEQYRPCHKALDDTTLRRRITPDEFREAVETAVSEGLRRLDGIRVRS
jgi:putative pyruvate formate lyase activating enzyme